MCGYPNAEAYLRAGDEAGARARVNAGVAFPEWSEADTWIVGLWEQMRSKLITDPWKFARRRCKAAGLDREEALEVMERAVRVDNVVEAYIAAIRERDAER